MIVDTSVQPHFRTQSEIRDYMPATYKLRQIPDLANPWYQAPGGDYARELYPEDWPASWPASDPDLVARHLFEERGVAVAILHPPTRGNLPDYLLHSQICSSTNDWLAQRWLAGDERFRGTIRVNPQDVPNAVAEIERWAAHPQMVQVGVPLQSLEPYGKPQFHPIWEAAAAHGLPVAVAINAGNGVDRPPTMAGHSLTYPHYAANMPLNFFIHLATLIIEGVFERWPNLVFVFSDGGSDVLTPLIYRLDSFWMSLRDQTPWVTKYPSEYLPSNVRFCTSSLDGPTDAADDEHWMDFHHKDALVMFGSQYPRWSTSRPDDILPGLSGERRERVMSRNADELYGLGLEAST